MVPILVHTCVFGCAAASHRRGACTPRSTVVGEQYARRGSRRSTDTRYAAGHRSAVCACGMVCEVRAVTSCVCCVVCRGQVLDAKITTKRILQVCGLSRWNSVCCVDRSMLWGICGYATGGSVAVAVSKRGHTHTCPLHGEDFPSHTHKRTRAQCRRMVCAVDAHAAFPVCVCVCTSRLIWTTTG